MASSEAYLFFKLRAFTLLLDERILNHLFINLMNHAVVLHSESKTFSSARKSKGAAVLSPNI